MELIPKELDTARDLARFLKLSLAAIRKWTRTTDMPRIRAGRAIRYDRAAVLAWLEARQRRH